jgi:hypothetical protein
MPRYKVLQRSFIGGRICEPGEEVVTDVLPGPNLQPLDKEGEKLALSLSDERKRREEERKAREDAAKHSQRVVEALAPALAATLADAVSKAITAGNKAA